MLFIGITGGTASGKTTIAKKIITAFPKEKITIIPQDSYYKDTSSLSQEERSAINFDHPDAIDFELLYDHLVALQKGISIQQPVYSFLEHNRTTEKRTLHPGNVILLEGILILTHPKIRALLDFKIYVEADNDIRLMRRLQRDSAERGRDATTVLAWYQNRLKPMHAQFIAPTKAYADLIIPNNKDHRVAVTLLQAMIKGLLKDAEH